MKKLFRKILRGTSLATALFIFEACYGTPYVDRTLDDTVLSAVPEEELPQTDAGTGSEAETVINPEIIQ